jgi:hypothetical protein
MLTGRRALLSINGVGGPAVLGSYAYCLLSYPERAGDFWGGVPEGLRSLYTLNMFLAAAGYLAFTFFLLYRWKPAPVRRGLGRFNLLYALVLIPSAAWMPLTFAMLEAPSDGLWWAIRLVLATVGIASIGLLVSLAAVRPEARSLAHKLAVAGSLAFCLQTAVLDAVVWPAFFPV